MTRRALIFLVIWLPAGTIFLFSAGRTLRLVAGGGPQPMAEVIPLRADFGNICMNERVRSVFVLRNSGNARLLVTDVRTGCECAVPELSSRVLAPGASTPLVLEFSPNRIGRRQLRVVVKTNDPAKPVLVLTLQATVLSATTRPAETGMKDSGAAHP
jgi:hypothetical protein